jgi:hypothetical protein
MFQTSSGVTPRVEDPLPMRHAQALDHDHDTKCLVSRNPHNSEPAVGGLSKCATGDRS